MALRKAFAKGTAIGCHLNVARLNDFLAAHTIFVIFQLSVFATGWLGLWA